MNYKISLVACARWEHEDVVEWVAYHRSLGIDHIYLYSNDDDPSVLRKTLAPYIYGTKPYLTYVHWPKVGQQLEMYLHFLRNFRKETEWFSFLDIDEFLTLKTTGSVTAFLSEFEKEADCIYLHWLIYGNAQKKLRDPSLDILPRYTRRSVSLDLHTKNIVRSESVRPDGILEQYRSGALGFWHFWDRYTLDIRIVDVLGNRIIGYARNFPESCSLYVNQPGYASACMDKAYITHFQFKSERDFLRRVERGGIQPDYWKTVYETGQYGKLLEKLNAVYDVTLARYWHQNMYVSRSFETMGDEAVPTGRANVALFKPSEQSSVYEPLGSEPQGANVQDHANDGVIRGTYGFCTTREEKPWWRVDLLDTFEIDEIKIYNRTDDPACAERARGLVIEGSCDSKTWSLLHQTDPSEIIGGLGSKPLHLQWLHNRARFIRLSLPGSGYFHLDEVQVFAGEKP